MKSAGSRVGVGAAVGGKAPQPAPDLLQHPPQLRLEQDGQHDQHGRERTAEQPAQHGQLEEGAEQPAQQQQSDGNQDARQVLAEPQRDLFDVVGSRLQRRGLRHGSSESHA